MFPPANPSATVRHKGLRVFVAPTKNQRTLERSKYVRYDLTARRCRHSFARAMGAQPCVTRCHVYAVSYSGPGRSSEDVIGHGSYDGRHGSQ
jgi:hypothetical protein